MQHYFKKLPVFLYICLALFAYSCSEEKNIVEEQSRINKVNLRDLPFLKKELNKETSKGSFAKGDIAYYLDRIITENIIEIIDQQGLKSYTFALNFREQDTLFNLCAKETISGYNYNLVKYSTTNLDQWIQDIKTTQQSSVMPEVEAERIDSNFILVLSSCVEYNFVCPSGLHNILSEGSCEYELTSWTATYNIVPCYVASNVGGSGDNGGSGANGSGPTITTMPNTTESGTNGNPCDKMKQLALDNGFRQKMNDLKQAANNYNFERIYTMYNNPNPPNQTDLYNYTETNGTVNNPSPNYVFSSDIKGIIHCHFNGLLNIFSPQDLKDLYEKLKLADITDDIIYGVVTPETASNPSKSYIIRIQDREKFILFGNQNLNTFQDFKDFENDIYNKKFGITLGNSSSTNELQFMKMLSRLNIGIDIYKGNNDHTNWQKLNLINNQIVPTNCN